MHTSWKKQFAVIYAGQAFSLLGSAAVQFAVIWWLTVQTESALVLTLSSIVAYLPNLLIGPFAGIWIDRYNRRTVMIAADGLVALSSVVLGAAFLLVDTPSIGFLFIILFVRGIGNTFHSPAMQAAIPMLVPAEMLTKAGGWGNLVHSLSNMLGPVLGAALMGFLPISGIMLVDILGAMFAVICLLFVHIPDIPRNAQTQDLLSDWKQGFATMRANRPLVAIFPAMVLCNVLYMPLGTLFPLLVRTHFLGTAWHNGIAEFVFAGGLLVSSIAIGIWGGMKRRFMMVSVAIAALGVASAVSGLLPANGFGIFVLCCFVMGCTGTLINVPLMAYTQETVAPEMMGKVLSLMAAAMSLAMPVGLLLAGPLSERVGVDRWFYWSGIALAGVGIVCRLLTRRWDAQTMRPTPGSTDSR